MPDLDERALTEAAKALEPFGGFIATRSKTLAREAITAYNAALPEPPLDELEAARLVADHWRKAALRYDDTRSMAHPLCMVLAALDGEVDPNELGVTAGSEEAEALEALAEHRKEGQHG